MKTQTIGGYATHPSKRPRNAVVTRNVRYCPRHGNTYVLRRGTNRCPVGRKIGVNCA